MAAIGDEEVWLTAETGVTDQSGNGYSCSYHGGMGVVDGKFEFDGANDYISVAGLDKRRANLSICGWVELDSYSGGALFGRHKTGTIFSALNTSITNAVYFLQSDAADGWVTLITNGARPTLNTLAFVCFVNNGSTATIYVNGVATGTVDTSPASSVASTLDDLRIGSTYNEGHVFLNGRMQDIRVFHRGLTTTEITDLYNAGPDSKPPTPSNLTPPTISRSGSTLTCDPGTWDANNGGTLTFSYQWIVDGVDETGETSSTLVITGDIAGSDISCRVVASSNYGSDEDSTETTAVYSLGAILDLTLDDADLSASAHAGILGEAAVTLDELELDAEAFVQVPATASLSVQVGPAVLEAYSAVGETLTAFGAATLVDDILVSEGNQQNFVAPGKGAAVALVTLADDVLFAVNYNRLPRRSFELSGGFAITQLYSNK